MPGNPVPRSRKWLCTNVFGRGYRPGDHDGNGVPEVCGMKKVTAKKAGSAKLTAESRRLWIEWCW
jgi:hypothetical protein